MRPERRRRWQPQTLGYEWDVDEDNGFQPAGSEQLSSTSVAGVDVLLDEGSTYGLGQAVHHLNLYRAPSRALVFGAGTVQWSWGLDSSHDRGSGAADDRMQQATANLLADMGVRGATLQGGLVNPSPPLVTPSTPGLAVRARGRRVGVCVGVGATCRRLERGRAAREHARRDDENAVHGLPGRSRPGRGGCGWGGAPPSS